MKTHECTRSETLADTSKMRWLHEQAGARQCEFRPQVSADDQAIGTHVCACDIMHVHNVVVDCESSHAGTYSHSLWAFRCAYYITV